MAFKNGSYIETSLVTATSGGTLTLVNNSATYQIFTGTLAHTLVLPDATTMPVGRRFEVVNTSTNVITVQSNSFAVVGTVPAGESKIFRLSDNSTSDGVFDVTVGGTSGGLSASEAAQAGALKAKSISATSKRVIYNGEVIGGNYWLTKSPLNNITSYNMSYVIGGYGYSVGGYSLQAGTTLTHNEQYNDDTNIWSIKQPLSLGRNTGASFNIGDYGFIAAGSTNISYNVDTLRYDPTLNTFSSRANMTTGRNSPGGGMIDNYGYCIAGTPSALVDTNTVERFNDTLNVWTFAAPSINTREYVNASTLNGVMYTSPGFRYAVGGETNTVEKYDSIKNSWAIVSPVYPLSLQGCTTSSIAGRFTVSGGHAAGAPVDNSYSWSETTGAWTARSPLPAVRRLAAGLDLNGVNSSVGGAAAGNTTSAVHYRYYFNAMIKTSILLNSNNVPTAISLPVLMNSISTNTQVQIRTNGYDWKNFISGGSVIKTGENLTFKFSPEGSAYMFGGRDSNVSERIDDEANAPRIVASTLDANNYGSMSFTINGKTYFAGGSTANTNHRFYDEVTNVWGSKANALNDAAWGGCYEIEGLGYSATGLGSVAGTTTNQNTRYDSSLNSWTSRTVHPSAVYDPGSVNLRGLGYVFSGTTSTNGALGGLTTASYVYTPATNAWTSLGNIAPVASIGSEYVPFGDTAVAWSYYTTGNVVNNGAHRYNSITNSYSSLSNQINLDGYVTGGRMSGNVFSMGGYNTSSGTFTAQVTRYNPNLNSWASRTALSVARYEGGASTTFTGSKLKYEVRVGVPASYVGGGGTWSAVNFSGVSGTYSLQSELEGKIYGNLGSTGQYVNVNTLVATQYAPRINTSYTGSAIDTLNGMLYAMGGTSGGAVGSTIAERYDPTIKAWASITSLNTARYSNSGRAFNGRFYTTSGYNGSNVGNSESYNPATNSWTTKTTSGNKYDHGAMTLNGYYYQIAGWTVYPGSQSAVDRYNDVADTYTNMASFPVSCAPTNRGAYNIAGLGLVGPNGDGGGALSDMYRFNDSVTSWTKDSTTPVGGISSIGVSGDTAIGGSGSQNYRYTRNVKNAVMSAALTVTE